jgi:hypothetical protein
MRVAGYWPLDGTAGAAFLRKLLRSSCASIERALRESFLDYAEIANGVLSGVRRTELEPENFSALVESMGGVDQAKDSLGIWEEDGKYWMRDFTGDDADRAFVACAVLFCAFGGKIEGEIYSQYENEIAACASKLSEAQRSALSEGALRAVEAIERLGDLFGPRAEQDNELMRRELRKFAEKFR